MWVLTIFLGLLAIIYVPLYITSAPTLQRYTGPRVMLSYVAMMGAAVFAPTAVSFMLFVLVVFVLTVRDRLDAACRLMLMTALVPNLNDHIRLGDAYLSDFSIIHALAIGVLVALAFKPNRPRLAALRGLTIEDALVAALVVAFWVGGTRFPSLSIFLRGGTDQAMLILLPYIALRKSVRSSDEFLQIMTCLAFGMVMLSVIAIYEARMGWAFMDPMLSHFGRSDVVRSALSRGGAVRASATQAGALALGVALLIGITAALYAQTQVRSPKYLLGWILLMVLGILAAQSRGNLALTGVALFVFCIARRKYGWAAIMGIGVPVMAGLVVVAANSSQQIASFIYPDAGAGAGVPYDYRQVLLDRGMEEAAKNRWFGSSMSNALDRLEDIKQGQHIVDLVNTYLTLYLIAGLAGLCVVVLLMVLVLGKLLRPLPREAGQIVRDAHGLTVTVFILMAVTLSYVSFIERVPFFLVVTLTGARLIGIERLRLLRARKTAKAQARFDALPLSPTRQALRPGGTAPA